MKAISDFAGHQIASAFVADEKGVFSWKDNAATMTIKNASDAELGDKMPEFTIDDVRQEEV